MPTDDSKTSSEGDAKKMSNPEEKPEPTPEEERKAEELFGEEEETRAEEDSDLILEDERPKSELDGLFEAKKLRAEAAVSPAQYTPRPSSTGRTVLKYGLAVAVGIVGGMLGTAKYAGDRAAELEGKNTQLNTQLEERLKNGEAEKAAIMIERDAYQKSATESQERLAHAEKQRNEYKAEAERLSGENNKLINSYNKNVGELMDEKRQIQAELEETKQKLAEAVDAQYKATEAQKAAVEPTHISGKADSTQAEAPVPTYGKNAEEAQAESPKFGLDYILGRKFSIFDAAKEAQIKDAQNYTAEMFGTNVEALIRYNVLIDGAQSHLENGTWGTQAARKDMENAYKRLQDVAPEFMEKVDAQLEGMRRAFIKEASPGQQQYAPQQKKRMRAS